MFLKRLLTFFILSLLLFSGRAVFAVEALQIDKIYSDSAIVSWDSVEGADFYNIVYDEEFYLTLGENPMFRIENIVDTTQTLTDLQSWLSYSLFVEARTVDDVIISTSEKITILPEVVFGFAQNPVEVINQNTIHVSFTKEIDTDAPAEFQLEDFDGNAVIIRKVQLNPQNPSSLRLTTSQPLSSNSEYILSTQSVTDVDGNNIESWVDALAPFATDSFEVGELLLVNANNGFIDTKKINDHQDDVSTEEELVTLPKIEPASQKDLIEEARLVLAEATTNSAPNQVIVGDSLPQTGTREVFILLISLILGWIVVFVSRRVLHP